MEVKWSDWAAGVAGQFVQAQEVLDDSAALAAAAHARSVKAPREREAARFAGLQPPPLLLLDRGTIQLDLETTFRESRAVQVGLALFGQPVSTFLKSVTRSSRTTNATFEVTVARVAKTAAPQPPKGVDDE